MLYSNINTYYQDLLLKPRQVLLVMMVAIIFTQLGMLGCACHPIGKVLVSIALIFWSICK